MKKTPPGWPRVSASVFYADGSKAIDFLCRAFGFRVRMKVLDARGRVEHSELEYGEGLVMVGEAARRAARSWRASPRALGGKGTQALMVYVDDVDAHCKQARKAGATIVTKPVTTNYGAAYWVDRGYEARDREGHHWWFVQRLRTSASERRARTRRVAAPRPPAKQAGKKRTKKR